MQVFRKFKNFSINLGIAAKSDTSGIAGKSDSQETFQQLSRGGPPTPPKKVAGKFISVGDPNSRDLGTAE